MRLTYSTLWNSANAIVTSSGAGKPELDQACTHIRIVGPRMGGGFLQLFKADYTPSKKDVGKFAHWLIHERKLRYRSKGESILGVQYNAPRRSPQSNYSGGHAKKGNYVACPNDFATGIRGSTAVGLGSRSMQYPRHRRK